MRFPRVRVTLDQVMVAAALIIGGSLVVGSLTGISALVAEADAVVFAVAYAAEVGLALVWAARCVRQSSRPCLRSTFVSVSVLAIMTWASIEWPVVRVWAFHAQCENMYRHDLEAGEQDPAERREQSALHSELRRKYQKAMVRPWTVVRP